MNDDTWVVTPVFDEAKVVRGVVAELTEHFPNVVAVDDGSGDGSGDEAAAGGAVVVRHAINLGQGAAIQTGVEYALRDPRCAFIVTFDADGQHDPADAAAMVERLRRGDQDVVVGSRFLGQADGMTGVRRAVLRLGAVFTRVAFGVSLTDPHCGLRAFDRRFAETMHITLHGMAHASEFAGLIGRAGARCTEVPITVHYNDYTRGKGQRSINSLRIAADVVLQRLSRGRTGRVEGRVVELTRAIALQEASPPPGPQAGA